MIYMLEFVDPAFLRVICSSQHLGHGGRPPIPLGGSRCPQAVKISCRVPSALTVCLSAPPNHVAIHFVCLNHPAQSLKLKFTSSLSAARGMCTPYSPWFLH
ncbi:hypothetical protein PAHAL_2G117300 [Panicum hallii]|jgi:hypothetical protein|uniref:Uncharacterized protein n=1 Tax=Panicum hallii TaxID=206008 RepID=A0A2T8KNV6_9POAL|nr:hypothetical protein PAHAL_2G117000 [Panicum hallii]PVH63834.1 hypothetical protein PAHAL_2G117300 [Panicum hallii]